MPRLAALSALILLAGCGSDAPPAEPPPPPPPPSFTDFAGDWTATISLEGVADSIPVALQSRPDGGGWVMSLEGRDSIPMRASMSGDSLVLLSEQYQSILRKDVVVQARTASVMADGGIVGKVVAIYNYPDSQQVVVGTLHGHRAP